MLQPHELDTANPEELMSFWYSTSCHPRLAARALFPHRPKRNVVTTQNLGHYASNKAAAILCRLRGDIWEADVYEGICESIYGRLPDYARW